VSERTDRIDRVRRVVEGVIGVPATEGNRIEVLRNGDEIFPAMLEAIRGARHTIDFLTFVYWSGEIGSEFARALADRALDDVRVRVLLDSWGAHPMDADLLELMESNGVCVHWFRPLKRFDLHKWNHRTHRKVLVVDEEVGFTGGVGIADEWQGDARDESEWRDTHFRVRGPVVDGLRAAFLDNWLETDPVLFEPGVDRFPDQPQPGTTVVQSVRASSEIGCSDVSTVIRTLMHLAEERIRVTTAYFVPDDELIDEMCDVARRGVRIELLLPGPHIDKRVVQLAAEDFYGRLLDNGIDVWCFQPSMLHAKVMTLDGVAAVVGSANFNSRSIALDEEICLVVLDPDLVDVLDRQFDEDLERSEQVEPGRWKQRPVVQRAFERATAPVKRLF
jgi:cardiolipin synthase